MMQPPPQRNQLSLDNEIALRGSIGGWFGSLLTAVILTVAVRNLFINTRTLEISTQNLQNTLNSAENTKEMLLELKSINQKLERIQ